MDELHSQVEALQRENQKLKREIAYQTEKHQQWKTLAMMFHDALWKLIEKSYTGDVQKKA